MRLPSRPRRAKEALARLRRGYPPRHAFLDHATPFQLLVAVALSAQWQDRLVNRVTPALFARFGTPEAMARASPEEVLALIRPATFAPTKAQRLVEMARLLVERFGGGVPRTLEDLTSLPGVGRKTASVVQGYVWGEAESVAVDTHVKRVSYRLGLTTTLDPDRAADELGALYPRKDWPDLNYYLIQHGRAICRARKPSCGDCLVADLCPKVGVLDAGGGKRAHPTKRPLPRGRR